MMENIAGITVNLLGDQQLFGIKRNDI